MFLFLAPSVSCPASCLYCNGPKEAMKPMSSSLAVKSILWAFRLHRSQSSKNTTLNVTFHGGEPLMAGRLFYEDVFRDWNAKSIGKVDFGIQSNLWLLTDDLCELLARYDVRIGTSLDGPQEVNDLERGEGYYDRTMNGVRIARRHSLPVSAIATFTKRTYAQAVEVMEHFAHIGMDFKANAAVPRLNGQRDDEAWILAPKEYATMLSTLFNDYLQRAKDIRIENIDRACRAVAMGRSNTCYFTECLGDYMAVDPSGRIFPCMRFVGHPEYALGWVQEDPDLPKLRQSLTWKLIAEWQRKVKDECKGCSYWAICMGGCPYNWLATQCISFGRDPYCEAYRNLYKEITEKATDELLSSRNRKAFALPCRIPSRGLMQRGTVLNIMSGDLHPDDKTMAYRRIVAAAALATNRPIRRLADGLVRIGVARDLSSAKVSLQKLNNRLKIPQRRANDVYLHVTNKCGAGCLHCYSSSLISANCKHIAPLSAARITVEAAALGYRRIVITGGEPLDHPERDTLLAAFSDIRHRLGACIVGLRTNLLCRITPRLVSNLEKAVDQIVVSVDGDPEYHDSRRFPGAYDQTVHNLKMLLVNRPKSVVRLAALVDASPVGLVQAEYVLKLAEELGIDSVVVRSPKPIGRAVRWIDWEHQKYINLPPEDAIFRSLYPRSSCGIGMNLHIEPDASVYPCYACLDERDKLGCWPDMSLTEILRLPKFREVLRRSVDGVDTCCDCPWRYLCGGICRAWAHAAQLMDSDCQKACAARKRYAQSLLAHALRALRIPVRSFEVIAGFNLGEVT